jgi:hypothetical protein
MWVPQVYFSSAMFVSDTLTVSINFVSGECTENFQLNLMTVYISV